MASQNATSVLQVLSHHIGAANGIRVDSIASYVFAATRRHISERDVRHAVVELRLEGHHICAHPKAGYYMAETEQELLDCCEFLHDRAMTSLRQISRMRNVSEPDLRGQLRLPT